MDGQGAGGDQQPGDQQPGYQPPAPFAPPALRTPPLNEQQVLGRSTYPGPPMFHPGMPEWHPPTAAQMQPAGAPRPGSRRRTIAVLVTVAVALCAVLAALLVGGGPTRTQHTLSLPNSAGGYVKLSTVSGSRITTILGSGTLGAIPSSDLAHAKVGVYGHGPQAAPSLVFIGFSAGDSPSIGRQLRLEQAGQVTQDVLDGAGTTGASASEDAGPLGGSLRCATVLMDGFEASIGVWADTDTLAMVLLFDPIAAPSLVQTGVVTRRFRAQAEH